MPPRIEVGSGSVVETYEGFVMDNRLGVAALAFLVYEYMITFEREVNLFWRSKVTGAVVLFFLNRYLVLATSLLAVSGIIIAFPASSCALMAKVTNAFAMLQYIPWAVFSAIRVYALSNSSVCMVLILLLSLAPAGAALAHFALGLTGEMDPVFGCIVFDPTAPDMAHKLTIGSRICLIIADALIILVTWKTIPRRGWTHRHSSTFGSILLWNGTLYFAILLVLNLLHLIFTVISISAPFQGASYVILFIHPITGILVSRFLFALQFANRSSLHLASRRHNSTSTLSFPSDGSLSFARVVGSLGSSLLGPVPSSSTYGFNGDYDDDEHGYNCDYGCHRDRDDASDSESTAAGGSPKPSLVIHINYETTVELGLGIGSRGAGASDTYGGRGDGDGDVFENGDGDVKDALGGLQARKVVTFDETVVAWDDARFKM